MTPLCLSANCCGLICGNRMKRAALCASGGAALVLGPGKAARLGLIG
ncbi:hypothetical protein SAMN04488032_1268 [Pacificibacter marinus]|uniref:Uncharacterized protein n=1 Tax=Pacificibacter marinus TaxID=658057 RepID=A0A1Y5TRU7_9RHOB|nr:hypothetical protein SAMN04488032_1268 [Pacificibacter marinus]SLN70618.1 hypothetical protein PAM7971_03786 [Pacificibacter marinus]